MNHYSTTVPLCNRLYYTTTTLTSLLHLSACPAAACTAQPWKRVLRNDGAVSETWSLEPVSPSWDTNTSRQQNFFGMPCLQTYCNHLILGGQNVNSQTIIKLKQQWPQSSFVLAKVDVISWLPDAAQLSEALSASKYDWLLIMVAKGRYHVKTKTNTLSKYEPMWFLHEGSFFRKKVGCFCFVKTFILAGLGH